MNIEFNIGDLVFPVSNPEKRGIIVEVSEWPRPVYVVYFFDKTPNLKCAWYTAEELIMHKQFVWED